VCLAGGELAQRHPHPVRSDPEEVVMFRYVRWLLLVGFLIVVGVWPSAAAPIDLAATGAAVILAAIPGPVLALAAVAAWLKHRPAPAKTVTA
jgi:hypothetical protein